MCVSVFHQGLNITITSTPKARSNNSKESTSTKRKMCNLRQQKILVEEETLSPDPVMFVYPSLCLTMRFVIVSASVCLLSVGCGGGISGKIPSHHMCRIPVYKDVLIRSSVCVVSMYNVTSN